MNKLMYYGIPSFTLLLMIPFAFNDWVVSQKTIIDIVADAFKGQVTLGSILFLIGIGILPFIALVSLSIPFLIKDEEIKKEAMILFTIINSVNFLIVLVCFIIIAVTRF